MTTKQVKAAAQVAAQTTSTPQNLYVFVHTFDAQGKTVGERIVDMCHYGTRDWLSKHLWWATHHGYGTEIDMASQAQIDEYIANGVKALAEKLNSAPAEVAAA